MSNTYLVSSKMLMTMYMQQMMLQVQLIEAQQQIIELQSKLSDTKPNTPPDHEVFWHLSSGGVTSTEAAASDDPELVEKFLEWNYQLAEKHMKPYVNSKVYGEIVNQMTRGLSEHLSELQTRQTESEKPNDKSNTDERIIQLALIKDA